MEYLVCYKMVIPIVLTDYLSAKGVIAKVEYRTIMYKDNPKLIAIANLSLLCQTAIVDLVRDGKIQINQCHKSIYDYICRGIDAPVATRGLDGTYDTIHWLPSLIVVGNYIRTNDAITKAEYDTVLLPGVFIAMINRLNQL